jgi:hypothetical protein
VGEEEQITQVAEVDHHIVEEMVAMELLSLSLMIHYIRLYQHHLLHRFPLQEEQLILQEMDIHITHSHHQELSRLTLEVAPFKFLLLLVAVVEMVVMVAVVVLVVYYMTQRSR